MGTNYMVADLASGPIVIKQETHFWKRNRIWLTDPFMAHTVGEIRFPSSGFSGTPPFWARIEFTDGRCYRMEQRISGRGWLGGKRYHNGLFDMTGPDGVLTYHVKQRLRRVDTLRWEQQYEGFVDGVSADQLLPAVTGLYLMQTGIHWYEGE